MQTLFRKLAIVDANDLTKRAVIPNIAEGVDGATAFGYENDYDMISIEAMQELPYAVTHTLEIRGLPTSSITEDMEHFNNPDVDTLVSAIGTDGSMVALDPVKLEWIQKPQDGYIWKLKITAKTVPYREKSNGRKGGGIHIGENILNVYSWADTDGDGIANGFSNSGFTSTSFSTGDPNTQLLSHADNGSLATYEFEDLALPYEADQLTFSLDVESLTLNGHDLDIRIEFFDETGSLDTTQSVTFTTTGRKSVSATIPSGTVNVRVAFTSDDSGGATATSDYELANPALRVDGKDVYTSY